MMLSYKDKIVNMSQHWINSPCFPLFSPGQTWLKSLQWARISECDSLQYEPDSQQQTLSKAVHTAQAIPRTAERWHAGQSHEGKSHFSRFTTLSLSLKETDVCYSGYIHNWKEVKVQCGRALMCVLSSRLYVTDWNTLKLIILRWCFLFHSLSLIKHILSTREMLLLL